MKYIGIFLSGLVLGGLAVAVFGVSRMEEVPTTDQTSPPVALGATRYNCELSGGDFESGACICPIEEFQTQEMMYDKETGFCQSTIGGPAGNAFNASVGLPWGSYAYYQTIVLNLCEESGGNFLYVCNCSDGKTYSQETGQCE